MDAIKTFQTMLTKLGSEMLLPLIIAGRDGNISKEEFRTLSNHAMTVLKNILNDYAQKQLGERPIKDIHAEIK